MSNTIALCAIGKGENIYIREWVEHYKSIGFKNIILCDNNDTNGEHFEDAIGDYILSGYVILKDYRGQKMCQAKCYTECYAEYNKQYDWMAFFDCDEFFTLEKRTLDEFLSQDKFKPFDCIRLSWKTFNDSGIYKIDGNFSNSRFTVPESPNAVINKMIKTIYRKGINNLTWTYSVHGVFHLGIKACDALGNPCRNVDKYFEGDYPIWEEAWINHYRTKTLEEYIRFKMPKLYPDHADDAAKSKLTMLRFFRYNDFTWEKWNYGLNILKELNMLDRVGDYNTTFIQFPKKSIF